MSESPAGMDAARPAVARTACALLRACLCAALMAAPWTLARGAASHAAGGYAVLVLLSHDTDVYQEVVDGMRAGMNGADGIRLQVVKLSEFLQNAGAPGIAAPPDLIVSVGTDAAKSALDAPSETPVYMTLVPKATSEALVREHEQTQSAPRRQVSAVYLDQPFRRQLHLLRLALPDSRRLGVVFGPLSRASERPLKVAADSDGLDVRAATIAGDNELFRALTNVLADSDVLLALPDPVVFNQHTSQNILLETYRQRKPVIGYSHAYVAAGALAAVYSTPLQIGRQIGEQLSVLRKNGRADLPPPRHPKYFTVEVNQQVSRSLGLTVAAASELQSKIEGAVER